MHVHLRHICQPQTWSHQDSQALCIPDSHLPFGAAPPGFQPGLAAWRNSLSSIPPTLPFTVCKPWPSARGMVLVALTVEYISRVLESWPFRCALSMHLCMVALWLFNKDEVCWTSITYLPLQRRCKECSSFIIFPYVVISLSLNDSVHNILNDVLKIMFIWSCWKLAFQWF